MPGAGHCHPAHLAEVQLALAHELFDSLGVEAGGIRAQELGEECVVVFERDASGVVLKRHQALERRRASAPMSSAIRLARASKRWPISSTSSLSPRISP